MSICAGQSHYAATFSDGKTILISQKKATFTVRGLESDLQNNSKVLKMSFSDNDEYLFIYRNVIISNEEYIIEKVFTVIETKIGEARSYVIERIEFES